MAASVLTWGDVGRRRSRWGSSSHLLASVSSDEARYVNRFAAGKWRAGRRGQRSLRRGRRSGGRAERLAPAAPAVCPAHPAGAFRGATSPAPREGRPPDRRATWLRPLLSLARAAASRSSRPETERAGRCRGAAGRRPALVLRVPFAPGPASLARPPEPERELRGTRVLGRLPRGPRRDPDPVPSVSLSRSLRGSGRGGRPAEVRAMLTRGTSLGPHWRPCNRAAHRSSFRTTFPFLPNSPGCWECSHLPWKQTQTEMRRARGPM